MAQCVANRLASSGWWGVFFFVLGSMLLLGCSHRRDPCTPADLNGCIVDEIDVLGNAAVSDDEVEEKIATTETGGILENIPILSALDALTSEDERFDRFVLERDLERIERLYRARGYYDAHVLAGRARRMSKKKLIAQTDPSAGTAPRAPGAAPPKITQGDPKAAAERKKRDDAIEEQAKHTRVLVEVVVDEGPPTVVTEAKLVWKDWDKKTDADAVKAVTNAKNRLKVKGPFDEEQYETVRKQILTALTDGGYAYAHVDKSADVDLRVRQARVLYTVQAGPKCKFGKVEIVGLGRIPEWVVRPALGFKENDEFSTASLESAEVALNDFNVFAAVAIDPALPKDGSRPTKVPIRITVEQAKLGLFKVGGGIEAGYQVASRGIVGWEQRNLFGIMDSFNIEARPRLVFYPWKLSTLFSQAPYRVVPEVATRAQYGVPVPFEPRTTIFAAVEASIARPVNADTPDHPVRTDNILGYQTISGRFGLERKFFLSRFFVQPSFNMTFVNPFSYNLKDPPTGLAPVTIRYLEVFLELDLRRGVGKWDPVNPRRGVYLSTDVQMSGFFMKGDANDVKVRPEFRFYAPLGRKLVLAGRVGTSLLYTTTSGGGDNDYGKSFDGPIETSEVENGCPTPAVACPRGDPLSVATARNRLTRDLQIMQLRGLFSGGPLSNRGYGWNEISPHRVLDDNGQLQTEPTSTGGRTEWDASLELRVGFSQTVGGTLFLDSSDVTAKLGEYRIDHPHMSTGVGFRYTTPVGPLRVDLGYRINGLQVIGQSNPETCTKAAIPCKTAIVDEGDPSSLLGLPLALSIAIGNAF